MRIEYCTNQLLDDAKSVKEHEDWAFVIRLFSPTSGLTGDERKVQHMFGMNAREEKPFGAYQLHRNVYGVVIAPNKPGLAHATMAQAMRELKTLLAKNGVNTLCMSIAQQNMSFWEELLHEIFAQTDCTIRLHEANIMFAESKFYPHLMHYALTGTLTPKGNPLKYAAMLQRKWYGLVNNGDMMRYWTPSIKKGSFYYSAKTGRFKLQCDTGEDMVTWLTDAAAADNMLKSGVVRGARESQVIRMRYDGETWRLGKIITCYPGLEYDAVAQLPSSLFAAAGYAFDRHWDRVDAKNICQESGYMLDKDEQEEAIEDFRWNYDGTEEQGQLNFALCKAWEKKKSEK